MRRKLHGDVVCQIRSVFIVNSELTASYICMYEGCMNGFAMNKTGHCGFCASEDILRRAQWGPQ